MKIRIVKKKALDELSAMSGGGVQGAPKEELDEMKCTQLQEL